MVFLGHFSITLLAKVITLVSGFLVSIIIVRFLGADGQGIYTLSIATISFLSFLVELGLSNANKLMVIKKRKDLVSLFSNLLVLVLAVTMFVSVWYFAFSGWPLNIFNIFRGGEFIKIILAILPLLALLYSCQGLLWGLNEIATYNYIVIIRSIGLLTLQFLLIVLLRLRIQTALYAWATSTTVAALISFFYLKFKYTLNKFLPSSKLFLQSLKPGLRSSVGRALWFIAHRIDIYLIGFFLGAAQVGYYSIAVLIFSVINFIPDAIGQLIFNRSITGEKKNLQNIMLASRSTVVFSIVASIFILIFAKYLITFFFGNDFISSFYCLLFLLPGLVIFNSLSVITSYIAGREDFPMFNNLVMFCGFVVNAILIVLLIPKYNINGAAIAFSLSQILQFILVIRYIRYKFKLTPGKFLFPNIRDFHFIRENLISPLVVKYIKQ